jgi:hypothetical protein
LTLSSSSISAVISPFANASGVHNTKLTAVADDENTAKFTLSSLSPLTRVAPSACAFPRVGVSHTPRTAAGGFGGVRVVVFTTVVIGAFPRAIGGFASTFPLAPVVASLRVVVVVRARARAPVPNVPVPVPVPPRAPPRVVPRASRLARRASHRATRAVAAAVVVVAAIARGRAVRARVVARRYPREKATFARRVWWRASIGRSGTSHIIVRIARVLCAVRTRWARAMRAHK